MPATLRFLNRHRLSTAVTQAGVSERGLCRLPSDSPDSQHEMGMDTAGAGARHGEPAVLPNRLSAPAATHLPRVGWRRLSQGLIAGLALIALADGSLGLQALADDDGHDHGSQTGGSGGSGGSFHPIFQIPRTRGPYEVWLSDQANTQGFSALTPNGGYGGKIRIYDSADLKGNYPINNPFILDVSTDLFPNALETTLAEVSRLHGIRPSPDSRYMALNFVASGHLGIVDGDTKKPVCLFRTTGTITGRQNHMTFWNPKGNSLIVANQGGRILERIDVVRNPAGNVQEFVFNANASLDFVGGPGRITSQPIAVAMDSGGSVGCRVEGTVADNQPSLTPSGTNKQDSTNRPLNTVICPIPSSNGRHTFATLGGGGMFVVDHEVTPMAIVADYDKTVMAAAGCGGVEGKGYMHMNTGTSAPNASEFTIYRFGLDYPSASGLSTPTTTNSPLPIAVWKDPQNGQTLPGNNRDAHGMVVLGDELHAFDRVRNKVEVFALQAPWDVMEPSYSYDLTTTEACGSTLGAATDNDPTPDLGDISPDGDTIYMALRGPYPLTVTHAASGSCPGLGIIRRDPLTKQWQLTNVLPSSVLDYTDTKNLSDPHDVVVRRNTSYIEVPGPLPAAGAAMALAWSRRLRRRLGDRRG